MAHVIRQIAHIIRWIGWRLHRLSGGMAGMAWTPGLTDGLSAVTGHGVAAQVEIKSKTSKH